MIRILVVDDLKPCRMVIRKALAKIGLTEVFEASDGAEAIKLFHQQSFDLIITDRHMPNVGGDAVLKAVRASAPSLPVIMLTADTGTRTVAEVARLGVSDFITKPFTADVVIKRVANALLKAHGRKPMRNTEPAAPTPDATTPAATTPAAKNPTSATANC